MKMFAKISYQVKVFPKIFYKIKIFAKNLYFREFREDKRFCKNCLEILYFTFIFSEILLKFLLKATLSTVRFSYVWYDIFLNEKLDANKKLVYGICNNIPIFWWIIFY